MGLETAINISQLVSANPTQEDLRRQGDDHLRLIKQALITTFPNINGPVTATPEELNLLVGLTAIPSVLTFNLSLSLSPALVAGDTRTLIASASGVTTADAVLLMPGALYALYPSLIITSWRPLTDQIEIHFVNAGLIDIPDTADVSLVAAVVR